MPSLSVSVTPANRDAQNVSSPTGGDWHDVRRHTLMSHRLELGCRHLPRITADKASLGSVPFVAGGSGPRQVVWVAARGSDACPTLAIHEAI